MDKQKENTDKRGLKNRNVFRRGDRVLLSTSGMQTTAVINLGANKLPPRFIGPLKVTKVHDDTYTLAIPTPMRFHPTFYVGRLMPYLPADTPNLQPRTYGLSKTGDPPGRQFGSAAFDGLTFNRDGSPPVVDASDAGRWIADRFVDHDVRKSREVPPRDGPKSKQKNNLARVTKKARSGPLVGIFTSGGYMGARSRLLEDIPDVVSVDETSLALALATINVDSTATDDLACTRRWLTMATTRPTSTAISMRRVATSATATTATTMDLRQRPLQERTLVALDPATLFIREPPNVNLGVPVFARGPITNLRAPEAALPNVHVADAPRLLRQITDTVPQLSNSVFPPAAPQVSEAMT
ncbi:hypothetical protein PC117_g21421 [Phytophthora cactorum]|uniref:Tf2-1-like SH3-like domain-containing protein n=3 Tax=Phytophthora cactorum TaxID=29920 RepID=A0A8T1BIU4_9STRA|nr:hypothetical protein PC117_g21421 [Phytophthora cactorum]KAG4045270.1 hypothetical protein PC123_g19318 [Phytophthora cactorum]